MVLGPRAGVRLEDSHCARRARAISAIFVGMCGHIGQYTAGTKTPAYPFVRSAVSPLVFRVDAAGTLGRGCVPSVDLGDQHFEGQPDLISELSAAASKLLDVPVLRPIV